MVFFNYSTMQMAAKVVYYGPGLCGKTTNLQWIFEHTSTESRGEMVSLATETDRTLFFDLLPIDVGSIAGFSTRIQLYTVPGQVFYNTTRKLVLKGVDGVVFVADSQRPMLQANAESFQNLEENLAEMGLSLDNLPVVLQYNKQDLPSICSREELDQALNRQNWPSIQASAINGDGVFETLKMISKATLMALKKRLTKSRPESSGAGGKRPMPPVARPPVQPRPAPARKPSPTAATVRSAAPAVAAAATSSAPSPSVPPSSASQVLQAVQAPPAAAPVASVDADSLADLDLEPPALEVAEPAAEAAEPVAEAAEPVAEAAEPVAEAAEPVAEAAEPVAEAAEPVAEAAEPVAEAAEPVAEAAEPVAESKPEPASPRVVASPAASVRVETAPGDDAAVAEAETPAEKQPAGESPGDPLSKSAAEASEPRPVPPSQAAPAVGESPAAARRVRKSRSRSSGFDALEELEKLRRQTVAPKTTAATNGKHEISRDFRMKLKRSDFKRAQRVSLTVRIEDADRQTVDETRQLHVDIDNAWSLEELLLRLNIAVDASA